MDCNEISQDISKGEIGCLGDNQNNKFDQPPYMPHTQKTINFGTLSMSAKNNISIQYNTHNLYALYESKASHRAMLKIRNERPFILSRSTFPSSGKYTAHWLGDNDSSFQSLYYSIPGILSFQLFGIPFTGSDICGFGGIAREELCTRWLQVKYFYKYL